MIDDDKVFWEVFNRILDEEIKKVMQPYWDEEERKLLDGDGAGAPVGIIKL